MASTAYSAHYDSSGRPIQGRPFSNNAGGGNNDRIIGLTFPTTNLDTLADVMYAIPVRSGKTIIALDLGEFTDMDTGGTALDMDIILRTVDKLGAVTDTILFNAGTFFTAAQTAGAIYRVWCNTKVPDCESQVGHICFYTNTAATTPAQGTGNLLAIVS